MKASNTLAVVMLLAAPAGAHACSCTLLSEKAVGGKSTIVMIRVDAIESSQGSKAPWMGVDVQVAPVRFTVLETIQGRAPQKVVQQTEDAPCPGMMVEGGRYLVSFTAEAATGVVHRCNALPASVKNVESFRNALRGSVRR